MSSNPREHWQAVYRTKAPTEVSWYQAVPRQSIDLIRKAALAPDAALIDIGAGTSTLVDELLAEGFGDVTVLDVAPAALELTRSRLGMAGSRVTLIAADVTAWQPGKCYDLWHDRAVFHFLVHTGARDRYLDVLRSALAKGGHVLMATFGPGGPMRCSGLEVQRYSAEDLGALLGPAFRLIDSRIVEHQTPGDTIQQFMYGLWYLEHASDSLE